MYFKVVAVKTLVVYLRALNKYSSILHGFFLSIIKMRKIIFPKGKRCIDLGSKPFELILSFMEVVNVYLLWSSNINCGDFISTFNISTVRKSKCSNQTILVKFNLTLSECYNMVLRYNSLEGIRFFTTKTMLGNRKRVRGLLGKRWNSVTQARLTDAKAVIPITFPSIRNES